MAEDEKLVHVNLMTTREDRAELRRRAAAEGVTMRTYILRRTLYPEAQDSPVGRPPSKNPAQPRLEEAS